MSKSLKRVLTEAERLGLDIELRHIPSGANTAQAAADAVGCGVDAILKSILFRVENTDEHVLFPTAGSNRVDPEKAEKAAGVKLVRADAASIRSYTGFAIGGVSPLGHLNPVRCFLDPDILRHSVVWAAAGTPQHMFRVDSRALQSALNAVVVDFILR